MSVLYKMWEVIKGYEGLYEINKKGEIRKSKNKKHVNQVYAKGYANVFLLKNGKQKKMQVHRLVGITFIENKENKPCINHINGVKSHNNVSNLEWVTNAENTKHAVRVGLIERGCNHHKAVFNKTQIELIRRCFEAGIPNKLIADSFGVTPTLISDIKNKKSYKNEKRITVVST